jgi:hypothetical protein
MKFRTWILSLFLACSGGRGHASIAYGSINNFDTVNDTGKECHGFEIELDDCRSTDISYTYDYNHYGVPKITEDNTVAGHPKCVIRWASRKNADGTWASYTAIPAGPIAATDGHMFTNPSVNFGGEHFGVGYMTPPTAVRYHWLVDDGAGNLVNGGVVQVATPVFVYYPAVAAAPAQVQAVIQPPEPAEVPVKEFGDPVWVKEIRTTTHNNGEVKLRDLVSDDPDDPSDKNWRNGEPDEVETEWELMQTEFARADGGPNGNHEAAPEPLEQGDEVVTRRYEFYRYIGPVDAETGEAMSDSVAPDGVHGLGVKEVNGVLTDLSGVEVAGEYMGAQMAAVDVEAGVGLTEHVSDGVVGEEYAPRTVVIAGVGPFSSRESGAMPAGMSFDAVSGVLSGTPEEAGVFTFTVTASDETTLEKAKTYTMTVSGADGEVAPHYVLDTVAEPLAGGTVTGSDAYAVGAMATVTAVARAGYRFVGWEEAGKVVSIEATHSFVMDVNHSLVAKFAVGVPVWTIETSAVPVAGGTVSGGGIKDEGTMVTVTAVAAGGYVFTNWTEGVAVVSVTASYSFAAAANRVLVANFTVDGGVRTVATLSIPTAGGTTSGGGTLAAGSICTVRAVASAGYQFKRWQENGNTVSTSEVYSFTVGAARTLTARFVRVYPVTVEASPPQGGTAVVEGTFEDGDKVTVTATANPGYTFLDWKENGTVVSTEAEYQFKANPARHLVATFAGGGGISWNVSVGAAPSGGGTVSGGGFREDGAEVTLRAVAADGYRFVRWSEGGVEVSRAAEYVFTATGDRVLTAVFVPVLGVEAEAGGRIRLTWAADATGWVLEENDGVDVAGWRPSGAAVVPTANGLTALVELVGPRRFWRLSHP